MPDKTFVTALDVASAIKKALSHIWQIVIPALIVSLILDIGLSLFTIHGLNQTNHNAGIQRRSQYQTCVADNSKATALIVFDAYQVKKQKDSIAQIKAGKFPQFNTPEIIAAAVAGVQKDIDAYSAEQAAYPILDCVSLYGPVPAGASAR